MQQLDKVQGYGQISSPSASTVDAYEGVQAVTQSTQLANALGNFAGAVAGADARNTAKAKKEKAALDAKKAQAHAARFKGEEGEFLDSVKLGETYADLSETVVATIVEDKYKNEYYTSAYDELRGLDDEIKGDVVALEAKFDSMLAEANSATEGLDFVNSGAVMGTRNAINEMRREFSVFRDQKTRELAKVNTEANVHNILRKYDLSTRDGMTSSVTLINDLNDKLLATSPFTKQEDKQQIVDALIKYNKLNPDSNATSIIQKIPWLQSKVTDQKLNEAAPVIANLGMQKIRNDAYKTEQANKKILADAQSKFNALALANDTDAIREAMAKTTGLTGNDAILGNAMYKMGEVALASAEVDQEDSQRYAAKYEGNLVVQAITLSDLKRSEVLDEIAADPNMREEEKEAIRGRLDKIMAGNDLIAAPTHSRQFDSRVGGEARAIDQSILNITGAIEGRTMEGQLRDVWDDSVFSLITEYVEENEALPEGRALRSIYDEAEAIVERRMEKLRSMQPGGTPQEQPQDEPEDEPQDLPVVDSQEEYDALPSGAQYLDQGKLYIKP